MASDKKIIATDGREKIDGSRYAEIRDNTYSYINCLWLSIQKIKQYLHKGEFSYLN